MQQQLPQPALRVQVQEALSPIVKASPTMMGFCVMQTQYCNAYYNTGVSEVHVLLVDMLHFEIWQTITLIIQRWATFPADLFVSALAM